MYFQDEAINILYIILKKTFKINVEVVNEVFWHNSPEKISLSIRFENKTLCTKFYDRTELVQY